MPPPVPSPYTGRIIVRLLPTLLPQIRTAYDSVPPVGGVWPFKTLEDVAGHLSLQGLENFITSRPYLVTSRLLSDGSVALAKQFEDTAGNSLFPPRRSLQLYWVVDARRRFSGSGLGFLISEIRQLRGVETAYAEHVLKPASDGTPCSNGTQEYLDGNNVGINVNNPLIFGAYNGAGVRFVDLETGWYFNHQDLPGSRTVPEQFYGDLLYMADAKHGTKTLGVVLAKHTPVGQGVLGIAPKADFQGCVSYRVGGINDLNVVDDAIIAGLVRLSPGGVLLLEVTTSDDLPIEVEDDKFDAIRLCVGAKGVTVVEAAGNGAVDLDGWVPISNPPRPLDRDSQNDSGAILVGGCMSATTSTFKHEIWPSSNFGIRIDASAWAEEVYTTEKSPADYDCFGGTSAASAIIAGAAILVQNIAQTTTGAFVSVPTVRDLLSDLSLGTPVLKGRGATDSVMPDLVKIASAMGALPDVFIRDSLSDSGSIPSAWVNQSPDIILASAQVAPGTFDTVASWAAMPASAEITPDADNYIYVRFRTRSAQAAPNTNVWLYWTETSTGAPPSAWNLIGAAPIVVNAPAPLVGDPYGPIVVVEFKWHPRSNQSLAEYPSTHGCLIAVLDTARDPAPPPLVAMLNSIAPITWDQFYEYLGQNNNVAFRNFNVESLGGAGANAVAEAEFEIYGFEREASEMAFEIELDTLPRGITFELDLPRELAIAVRRANRLGVRWVEDDGVARLMLPAEERFVDLERVRLAARARHRCTARLRVAEDVEPCNCHVLIRQRFEGRALGGLTIALRPESWRTSTRGKRAYGSQA